MGLASTARLTGIKNEVNRGAKKVPATIERGSVPTAPETLADVALIDAEKCAAVGDMSVSWWNAQVAAGRAPAPAFRLPRCTRWRVVDVREFWRRFTEESAADADAAGRLDEQARKASGAAKTKREAVR